MNSGSVQNRVSGKYNVAKLGKNGIQAASKRMELDAVGQR